MSQTPTISRREENAEATRLALLDAAREVFVEAGYQQAGIEAIARKARVTRGAFYHHFADKRALLDALVVALQVEAAARLVKLARSESDGLKRLQEGARVFLEVCMEPAYRRLVIQDAPAVLGSKRCREIAQDYSIGLLIRALGELKATGAIEVENVEMAGRMIGAMICEAALLLEDVKRPKVLERQALEIVQRTLSSISRPA